VNLKELSLGVVFPEKKGPKFIILVSFSHECRKPLVLIFKYKKLE